jgi:hypothetical protein
MIGLIAIWFVVELVILKLNLMKGVVERIKSVYLKKLHEEYSKGDVTEE